jgi:hypothetical protein
MEVKRRLKLRAGNDFQNSVYIVLDVERLSENEKNKIKIKKVHPQRIQPFDYILCTGYENPCIKRILLPVWFEPGTFSIPVSISALVPQRVA